MMILKSLDTKEYKNITSVSKELSIPRTTLVNYINKLLEENVIEKHGGNIKKVEKFTFESKSNVKFHTNADSKRAIAKKASSYIIDKDIIFIDGGSTTIYMLEFLADLDIVIYTNNITLLEKLPSENFKPKVYSLPGSVYKNTSTIVGALTVDFISRIYIDKSFIGTNEVRGNWLLTTNQEESIIKRAAIKNSKNSYVLYDKSKIDTKMGKFKFAEFDKTLKGVCE